MSGVRRQRPGAEPATIPEKALPGVGNGHVTATQREQLLRKKHE
jgi:hypothetical protein